jgi:hypothetical protein
MGQNKCESGRFTITDFDMFEFGEKGGKLERKIPEFMGKFEFEIIQTI